MKKKSFNDQYRDKKNDIACQAVEGGCGPLGVILFKTLEDLKLPKEANDAVYKILESENTKRMFPDGFRLDKIPFLYLISRSKLKESIVNLKMGDGSTTPVIILKKEYNGKTIIGFNYISLKDKKVVYASSADAVKQVQDSLDEIAQSTLLQIQEVNSPSNMLSRDIEVKANDQILRVTDGDVTNLHSSKKMLEKCKRIIETAVSELDHLQAAIIYNKQHQNENDAVFDDIDADIEEELKSPSPQFIINDKDAVNALIHLYNGRATALEQDYSSGKLRDILQKQYGQQRHNLEEIVALVIKILKAFEQGSVEKAEQVKNNRNRKMDIINNPEKSDFKDFPLHVLEVDSDMFASYLPGNPSGFKNKYTHKASSGHIIEENNIKILAFKEIIKGIEVILHILTTHKSPLSTKNFTDKDISALASAFSQCIVWINTYKVDIVNKKGKINKTILGSVYSSNTALRFYSIRYVALTIKYIQTVFTKNNLKI